MQMAPFIQEVGKMIYAQVKVHLLGLMKVSIQELSNKISITVKELSFGQRKIQSMLVHGKRVNKTVSVLSLMMMVAHIKVNGEIVKEMVRAK